MVKISRWIVVSGLFLCMQGPVLARQAESEGEAYVRERSVIESVFGTVVKVIRDAAMQNDGSVIGDRLKAMAEQLNNSAPLAPYAPAVADETAAAADRSVRAALEEEDLRELEALLRDLNRQLLELREDLVAEQSYEMADRLAPIARTLDEAVTLTRRLIDEDEATERTAGGWLRPGRYDERGPRPNARREAREEAEADDRDDDWKEDRRDRPRWRPSAFEHTDVGTIMGDFPHRWPYHELALYRSIPAVRYNRVEGFVLGFGLRPLGWDDYERARLVGQFGYAFALERLRYEVGVETRPSRRYNDDFGLKLGGSYRRNTATNDLWKSSWIENSLAAFFFENDFFDYYEVEGWSLYAVGRITPYAQVSAGFRAEDYRSLDRNTTWSLFGGDGFRFNPPVDEGYMQSLVFAFEGGRVEGLHALPRGVAFRAEVEVGDGVGGDFAFMRYLGDARFYLPFGRYSTLALRARAGVATSDGGFVPYQKAFTIGGIGSVRGYPQNAFFGTRMLLGNAEYIVDDVSLLDDVFDDIQLFGFADAGWVNRFGRDDVDFDGFLTSAGFGVGLDDRSLRLELAWPLTDAAGTRRPSLWLRLSPTF